MAQIQEVRAGEKRGPGRPYRTAIPAAKKARTSAGPLPSALASPVTRSPAVDVPVPDKIAHRLPAKVVESKPLPSLAQPQAPILPDEEYQSLAASAVLQASLDRSRRKYIHDGIFQRYWVKPESGKNAKPPPPNNPELKWMKSKGECRIRLEPHLFTAEVFLEEKPKPKPYMQPYSQQYRPPQNQPYGQPSNRPFGTQAGTPQPLAPPPQQAAPPRAQPSPAAAPRQDKKPSPDPVISMLANRASSDLELKTLMKEVATGNANQDQLRIFQRHIDELTAIIQKEKKQEEEQAAKERKKADAVQYDGARDVKPQSSQLQPPPMQHPAQQLPPPPVYQPMKQVWTPPAKQPVVLQFNMAGATEDRFLFPQNSILEPLSPQHELVSFMVVRKGRDAADPTGLEPDKEYWQPITMMVEVMYGKEDILGLIRRWVKPADEVRKYMEGVMERCSRVPASYLALRLPFKGSAISESEVVSKEATPIVDAAEKSKTKATGKSTKKIAPPAVSKTPGDSTTLEAPQKPPDNASTEDAAANADTTPATSGPATDQPSATETKGDVPTPAAGDATKAPSAADEGGRPRRGTRKSVRISEG